MNINENNKLIAEFIGITLVGKKDRDEFFDTAKKYFRKTEYETDGLCPWCHNHVNHGHNAKCYVLDESKLKYDTDWNWLMSVVEKIENEFFFNRGQQAKYNVNVVQCFVEIVDNENSEELVKVDAANRKDAIYQAVVDFVRLNRSNKG